ncbi:MAG: hypothetical protein GY952_08850 [Rhodobacteraceae bacterium]|nr:hypothetical protein [Paracoccaceae bacterium]
MTTVLQDPAPLFTDPDGSYRFARWGRPVVPVVFGVDDDTLTHLKDAIARTVAITGGRLEETDPELGANFMWFFCQEWEELEAVPNLDQLFPDFTGLMAYLKSDDANQYRSFAFDADGAIKMGILLLRMDETLSKMPIQTLATSETFQSLLLWADGIFAEESPIALIRENGICIVKPEYAAVLRSAYDPTLPVAADDASHALRLAARAQVLLRDLDDET